MKIPRTFTLEEEVIKLLKLEHSSTNKSQASIVNDTLKAVLSKKHELNKG